MATMPKTYESAESDQDAVNKLVESIKTLIGDPKNGWKAAQAARKAFVTALAPLVVQLRSECRHTIRRKGEDNVILADWYGNSPDYAKAWGERVLPLLRAESLTSEEKLTKKDVGTFYAGQGQDVPKGNMDGDLNGLTQALGRRVRSLLMENEQAKADMAYMAKIGAARPGRPARATAPTVVLPSDGTTPEDVFATVEVPESISDQGIAKLAEMIFLNARRLRSMVEALAEQDTAVSGDERNKAAGYAKAAAIVLGQKSEDGTNVPEGVAWAILKLKVSTETAPVEGDAAPVEDEAALPV